MRWVLDKLLVDSCEIVEKLMLEGVESISELSNSLFRA
jgi:hypothetical protein